MTGVATDAGRGLVAGTTAVFVAAAVGVLLILVDLSGIESLALFPFLMLFAVPVASVHAALIAAPLYLLLGQYWPLRWWNATLAGLVTGAVPIAASWMISDPAGFLRDPQTTAGQVLGAGFCGLVGGLTFRAVRGPRGARRDEVHVP